MKLTEEAKTPGQTALTEAAARNLFKLMAYKDEYEVARLYTDGTFRKQIASTFEDDKLRFEFHLAPPLLAKKDKETGELKKQSYGPWILSAFRVLKHFRFLRGTPFDPFGYTHERRTERKLIRDYEKTLEEIMNRAGTRTITPSRSASPPFRKKSAASAMSRRGISSRRRPTRRPCSISCGRASRRCSRPPSKRAIDGLFEAPWLGETSQAMAIHTALTDTLDIRHPVLLAPMDLVADGKLAAAVSSAGGFGILGGGYGDETWLKKELDVAGKARVGVGFITWSMARQPRLLDVTLERKPAAVMLSFGDPAPHADRIKRAGALLICQVQTAAMAKDAVAKGADIIVAQGTEGGGHGGSVSTMPLVPAIVDAVGNSVPVVAAGGIADGRGLAAALMLGAIGVLLGTRFYASSEAAGHVGRQEADRGGGRNPIVARHPVRYRAAQCLARALHRTLSCQRAYRSLARAAKAN